MVSASMPMEWNEQLLTKAGSEVGDHADTNKNLGNTKWLRNSAQMYYIILVWE